MHQYRVRLTWMTWLTEPGFTPKHHDWQGVVEAANVDAALRAAKLLAGAPTRATSETQRT
jgi:hypothetical protein